MIRLGHAEAHERLADLALEPGALDALGAPDSDALAAHLVTCATCRADVDAWRRTQARLAEARGPVEDRVNLAELAGDEPIGVPAGLRDAVLSTIRRQPGGMASTAPPGEAATAVAGPVVDGSESRPPAGPSLGSPSIVAPSRRRLGIRRPSLGGALALVAVLAVAVVGGATLIDQATRLDHARQETAALEAVTATVDRILRDPSHRIVDLRGVDGQVEGTLSWSSRDIVVLTTALGPPPADRVYRCWIERDGTRSKVGEMWFAKGTAFWNGSLGEWATTSFEAGGTFGVSLEPVAGPAGNPAVLVAELPG
jgi:Anti-sigma-K factor rskA, C-terminal